MEDRMKKLKVIQWGVGYIGAPSVRYILGNDALDLVGIKCHTPEKVGLSAGEIAGLGHGGPCATDDIEKILALEADCVVFMPRDPMIDPSVPGSASEVWINDLVRLLESGKNVVSSIAPCVHWRHLEEGARLRDLFNAACARGGVSLHFTGMDPGFNTDVLPFMLSSAVGDIRSIRTFEIIDWGAYPVESVLRQVGFGGPIEALEHAKPSFRAVWGGAVYLLAEALGVEIDRLEVVCEGYPAPETYVAEGGMRVERGTVAAYRFWVTGYIGDTRFIDIQHVTRMGHHLAPEWPTLGRDGGYRIIVDGYPPFHAEFPMGFEGGTGTTLQDAMTMTAARCVNHVEAVVAASTGYHTFLSLPLVGGRHAVSASVGARPYGSVERWPGNE
jgi:2,4-diaminopentanoate dehydrogenase